MDLKQLVEAITKEVVNKLETGTPSVKPDRTSVNPPGGLVVLGGGEEGFDEAFQTLRAMVGQDCNCAWAISKEAREKLGEEGLRKINPHVKNVEKDVTKEIFNMVKEVKTVIIPVLTMSDAFKISSLIGDTFISKIVLQALYMGKKVVCAPDGIFLSLSMSSTESICTNSRLDTRLRARLDQLRSLGVELVPLKNFREHLSELTSSKVPENSSLMCSWSKGGECGGCGLCVQGITANVEAIVEAGATRVGASPGVSGDIKINLAELIDHTLLKPDATKQEIIKLCEEARKYKFASVCINPTNVALARDLLAGSPVKVCTVVGFPLGADTSVTKAMETRDAVANGADEIDMVINVGALKAGDYNLVLHDIKSVVDAAGGRLVKVILETALLNREEKIKACELSKEAGADFVKTSTGFGPGGATAEDIALMREVVGKYMGVKASGGIRDYKKTMEMVKAGATRIGASASVSIVENKAAKGDGY